MGRGGHKERVNEGDYGIFCIHIWK
jgi:hypothetical protein